MKVKLTNALVSTKGSWKAGQLYECSKNEAERLIKRGLAVKPTTRAKK